MRVPTQVSFSALAVKAKMEMKKPTTRADLPPRNSDNRKQKN
jgi:hypothetical protein